MTISAAEQYGIELLNRARLNPVAEADRYNVPLNRGVYGNDVITTAQKQVLAPDAALDKSATRHSGWMMDTDTFSHTGVNGTSAKDRMANAGFGFNGGFSASWGENLALIGARGITMTKIMDTHHRLLMQSADHRPNILRNTFREIGYGEERGTFGGAYRSVVTQNFAHTSNDKFITGVVYDDKNSNNFYNIGEGRQGVTFGVVDGGAASSASAGGYAVRYEGNAVTVEIRSGDKDLGAVMLRGLGGDSAIGEGNVKLDYIMNSRTVFVAGNASMVAELGGGMENIRLLGINGNKLIGNDLSNRMTGNLGKNTIEGRDGNDTLSGGKGNDSLLGQSGNDVLKGENGRDTLNGGADDDMLTGGAGADTFVFGANGGADTITDFNDRQGDHLNLAPAIWGGDGYQSAAEVVARFADVVGNDIVFDFENGQTITLQNVTNLSAVAEVLTILF